MRREGPFAVPPHPCPLPRGERGPGIGAAEVTVAVHQIAVSRSQLRRAPSVPGERGTERPLSPRGRIRAAWAKTQADVGATGDEAKSLARLVERFHFTGLELRRSDDDLLSGPAELLEILVRDAAELHVHDTRVGPFAGGAVADRARLSYSSRARGYTSPGPCGPGCRSCSPPGPGSRRSRSRTEAGRTPGGPRSPVRLWPGSAR